MGRKDLTPQRRDAILDAAERCIAKYGLHSATLEKIALEANVNRGLIHHYVGNRNDVIKLMVERLPEKHNTSFENYVATHAKNHHGEIVVDYFFDAWFELAPEDDALIMELLAESERDPYIHQLILTLYNDFENMIEKELLNLFPNADSKRLRSLSYSLMLLAFSHATFTWLGFPSSKKANIRAIAADMVQTLN